MIYNPDNPSTSIFRKTFEAAATQLHIEPLAVPIHRLKDIDLGIAQLADRKKTTGVFTPPDVTIKRASRRSRRVGRERYGVRAIYQQPAFVRAGGLVSYGVDRIDLGDMPPNMSILS
jgi:ABC-type uncharacterized transport system substrate-binding protein